MKIAVTSQNRREITEHAGRCRKFWIYDVEGKQVINKTLLEISKENSFHESSRHAPHPLDDVSIVISASMGHGMKRRLASKGIVGVVTTEKDPDTAVAAIWEGANKASVGHHVKGTTISQPVSTGKRNS